MSIGVGLRLAIDNGGGGISALNADLALWFDQNISYKSSGGDISRPDDILTYTAPSPKLVYGSDGVLRYAPHNLLTYSQTFTNAFWTTYLGSTTDNNYSAPDGSVTAARYLETASSGVHRIGSGAVTATNNTTYTFSVYLQTLGRQWAYLNLFDTNDRRTYFDVQNGAVGTTAAGTTAAITSVGNGWYRCSITLTVAATTLYLSIGSASADGTVSFAGDTAKGVYAWGAQLNLGPTALTYIPTTTAAVYSLPRDHNPTTGAALGVLVEEARTNLCLYSDDFTNAAWVKSNLTAAKTATGPDGVANSASTLTATAANATALQAITSTSAARITSMFVKRRTGTGAVEMTQDNGSTWTAVTVTAGWTRVNIATATAANPTVGIRIVTDTDAIDVDLFQHELGAFITSPVPTVASQVTRAADDITILTSAFPFSATEGTVAVAMTPIALTSGNIFNINAGALDATSIYSTPNVSSHLVVRDTTTQANLDAGTFVASQQSKIAVAYKADDFAASLDGGAVVTDAAGTIPASMTVLCIGTTAPKNGPINGHIKRLDYYAVRKTNAELVVLST
jgi:hypothetical protein